ncbi:DNA polymerase III subunit delta [Candidatus Contubernalis alkaliaceticus]|uniref:DNA polymerase III subunit delta n=1 Tax=Candidatus Contubernalis alkaliaceticus TaxID=338645 RepID=UPI001F4BEEA1|nr:DNA polymerase III subunit delta [Candidatus Contubernalis alkalaceticus]UNC93254.1 DNA polymerase III subunit delta [Candidatus Contubernalis alkalaceticus]
MDAAQALREIKKDSIFSCYLLYGEEKYLKKKILEALQAKLLDNEMLSFNYDIYNGKKSTIFEIISRAESPPVLSENRLLVISDSPYFFEPLKDREAEALKNYLEKPVTFTCLVFMCPTIDRRKKLTKIMLKNNWAISCEPIKGNSLNMWIRKRFQQENKVMEPEAQKLLIQRAGPNLERLENELNKLFCYLGEEKVMTREMVDQLIVGQMDVNIFELVDSLGSRDQKKALILLQGILRMNEHPLKILTMVARQFRLLLQVKYCLEEGIHRKDIASHLKLAPFIVNKLLSQTENFSIEELSQALILAHETDLKIKTGRQDPYEAMDLLLADLMN